MSFTGTRCEMTSFSNDSNMGNSNSRMSSFLFLSLSCGPNRDGRVVSVLEDPWDPDKVICT